ncbi:hypothetical protein V6N12_033088 [Hibiscus sabdariffa]|uniref:Uncharacterized protein n=1 Tax=Hibiscus sabdariffa TaxID=183260 RepID=A0ABR2BD99_9ROSI
MFAYKGLAQKSSTTTQNLSDTRQSRSISQIQYEQQSEVSIYIREAIGRKIRSFNLYQRSYRTQGYTRLDSQTQSVLQLKVPFYISQIGISTNSGNEDSHRKIGREIKTPSENSNSNNPHHATIQQSMTVGLTGEEIPLSVSGHEQQIDEDGESGMIGNGSTSNWGDFRLVRRDKAEERVEGFSGTKKKEKTR